MSIAAVPPYRFPDMKHGCEHCGRRATFIMRVETEDGMESDTLYYCDVCKQPITVVCRTVRIFIDRKKDRRKG